MENNKNKKSVNFQGDMLNFCDFIQVFIFTTNHHLNACCSKNRLRFGSLKKKSIHPVPGAITAYFARDHDPECTGIVRSPISNIQIQQNFSGSNTDGSFTMTISNLF